MIDISMQSSFEVPEEVCNEPRGEGHGEEQDEDYQGLSHVDGCDVTGSAVNLTGYLYT